MTAVWFSGGRRRRLDFGWRRTSGKKEAKTVEKNFRRQTRTNSIKNIPNERKNVPNKPLKAVFRDLFGTDSESSDADENTVRKAMAKPRDENPAPVKMSTFDHRGAEGGLVAHNGLSESWKFTDAYMSPNSKPFRRRLRLWTTIRFYSISCRSWAVAETGHQYKITTKRVDFDLCLLDSKIIERLLNFF